MMVAQKPIAPTSGPPTADAAARGTKPDRPPWWVAPLCFVAAVGLAAIILWRFGREYWTAALMALLLICPLSLVWGLVQSLRRNSLITGPAPETRGVTIDALAPVYDAMCWMMGMGPSFRRRTVALAQLRPGERVLDVGCGTGVLTRFAAEAVGTDGIAIGIDPGPAMISAAILEAARWRSRAAFALGVVERMEFADGRFDVVLSSFMLHHLPADLKRDGLAEMWRVLKPGGRLVLADVDPALAVARAMLAIMRLVPAYDRVHHVAGDPVPLLRAAGFADAARVGTWRAIAGFWLARKPALLDEPTRYPEDIDGRPK